MQSDNPRGCRHNGNIPWGCNLQCSDRVWIPNAQRSELTKCAGNEFILYAFEMSLTHEIAKGISLQLDSSSCILHSTDTKELKCSSVFPMIEMYRGVSSQRLIDLTCKESATIMMRRLRTFIFETCNKISRYMKLQNVRCSEKDSAPPCSEEQICDNS